MYRGRRVVENVFDDIPFHLSQTVHYVFKDGQYVSIETKNFTEESFVKTEIVPQEIPIVLSSDEIERLDMQFHYLKEIIELFCDCPSSPYIEKRLMFVVRCVRFIFSLSDTGFQVLLSFLTRKRIKKLFPVLKQFQLKK